MSALYSLATLAAAVVVVLLLLVRRRDDTDDGPLTLSEVRGRIPRSEGWLALRWTDPRSTETARALYPEPNNECPRCGVLFEPLGAETLCFDCRHPHVGVVRALRRSA